MGVSDFGLLFIVFTRLGLAYTKLTTYKAFDYLYLTTDC